MARSYARVLIHGVFSTKNRVPCILKRLWSDLHAYMAATLNENDLPALCVGGVEDHVHALFSLGRTTSVSDAFELMKSSSSRWLKTRDSDLGQFAWQSGYGAFSVSQSGVDAVVKYIQNQEAHHKSMTFQDELRALLKKHEIEYDERYLWD